MEVDEEMRRVLDFGTTRQDYWRAEVLRRPLPDPKDKHLRNGLSAYAAEHIDREKTIIRLWEQKWRAVRLLADPIIAGNIPDDTKETVYTGMLQELEVEMPDEEEWDDFEMDSNLAP